MNAVSSVIETLLRTGAAKAVKYLSEKKIVRASQRTYKGKVKTQGNVEVVLILGKPNFKERLFVKKLKKAGEPFPVKKIQLKFPVKK